MKPRKIALISAIAVLLCVYVVQLLTLGRGSVRDMKLSEAPDTIVVTQGANSVTLALENGSWVVGDKKYPADQRAAEDIAATIGDIKVLDTVAKIGSDAVLERYGLDAAKAIIVKALKGGEELRALTVGKDATTASQTYVSLQGGKDIYLASGSLRTTFGKSVDELRSSTVYSVKYDDMSKVTVSSPAGIWALEKSGSPAAWTIAPGSGGAKITIDHDKAAFWIKSLAELNADSWLADDASLPKVAPTTITIALGDHDISVSIYPSGSGKDPKYLCASNATPYRFVMGGYEAEVFLKKLDDLKK